MNVSVQEKILNSANKVISEKGLKNFTLEKVAQEASISKGGLLYHFSNKESLITALVNHYIEQFDDKVRSNLSEEKNPTFEKYIKAFVIESFEKIDMSENMMMGLLAAITIDKELLAPVVKFNNEWQNICEKSKDPIMSSIIRLATEGLIYSELLNLNMISDDMRVKVRERLLQMIAKETSDKTRED